MPQMGLKIPKSKVNILVSYYLKSYVNNKCFQSIFFSKNIEVVFKVIKIQIVEFTPLSVCALMSFQRFPLVCWTSEKVWVQVMIVGLYNKYIYK